MVFDRLARLIPGFTDPAGLDAEIAAIVPSLAGHRYLLLTTFRKDGSPVATPVWFAPDGDRLVVITVADSYKVRRIRANSGVRIAPCDVRGKPLGDERPATAELVPDELPHVRELIGRRYGLQARMIWLAGIVRPRSAAERTGIALRVSPGA